MKHWFFFLAALAFVSCKKDEIPVKKPQSSSADVVTVAMGSDYANQLFFNLKDKKVVLKNNREVWDLAFESGAEGFHIMLNGSKMMGAFKTAAATLAEVTSAEDIEWNWDRPSGRFDSTAIGDWRNDQHVYLINLGTSLTGTPLGTIKLKVLSSDESSYKIEWADIQESTSRFSTIPKDPACSFTYFSFSGNGTVKTIEPPKETWDICFTCYTHVFDAHTPYLVTGVISNRYGVRVKPVNDKSFASITYVDYLSATFNEYINNIGYNWKTYDFDTGIYKVDMTQNFIVETLDGRAYKLHFLDFYDDFGVKGAPSMELQELVP